MAATLEASIAVKRNTLDFLSKHGTGRADEAEHVAHLLREIPRLEEAVHRLRQRHAPPSPDSPPDTPPDQLLIEAPPTPPVPADPTAVPLHVPDRGAGVLVPPTALDVAGRSAARNLVEPSGENYRVPVAKRLVDAAGREAEDAERARLVRELLGVFVVVRPGVEVAFRLGAADPDGPCGDVCVVEHVAQGSAAEQAGLREGLMLHSVDGVAVLSRDYSTLIHHVEDALTRGTSGLQLMFVAPAVVAGVRAAERAAAEAAAEAAAAAQRQEEAERAAAVAAQVEAEQARVEASEAAAAEAAAAVVEARSAAVAHASVDLDAALPQQRFRRGATVKLADSAELTDEQERSLCLRPAVAEGSMVTPAVVGKVLSAYNPWEAPERLQRQLQTRRTTLAVLTAENLLSATHSVRDEIVAMEQTLREALAEIAAEKSSVMYNVESVGGRRAWYREEQLTRASAAETAASEAREGRVDERVMDMLGFLSLKTDGQIGLSGEASAHLDKMGIARPASFLSAAALRINQQARDEKNEVARVLSMGGVPSGAVSRSTRTLLLREELAVAQEGMGQSVRLLADYGTGGRGRAELDAALSVMAARRTAATTWALTEHPERAEWAAGRWARAKQHVRGRRAATPPDGEESLGDELTLREEEVIRLSAGLPNKWWKGTTVQGREGDVCGGAMEPLEKAIALRGFEPFPGQGALYMKLSTDDVVCLVDSNPTAKWWQGFVLNPDGSCADSCRDSSGQVTIKLLPRQAVLKETEVRFQVKERHAQRWGECASGIAQASALASPLPSATAGRLAHAVERGWTVDIAQMEAATAAALRLLADRGGRLKPATSVLEFGSGVGLWRLTQAVRAAGVLDGETAAAEQRLAAHRAELAQLKARQDALTEAGDLAEATDVAELRELKIKAQQAEWVHGGSGGQVCGMIASDDDVELARMHLTMGAQAHAAEGQLALASLERRRLEGACATEVSAIRLLLARDGVVIEREMLASQRDHGARVAAAKDAAAAGVEAAEAAVAGRIATAEAELAANIAEIEAVCEAERVAAAEWAEGYISDNLPHVKDEEKEGEENAEANC